MVTLFPVGLTLSIPLSHFSSALFQQEKSIHIQMCKGKNSTIDWKNISYAIEAGIIGK